MDAKGRVAIPAKHRDVLLNQFGGDLVLTLHQDNCLMLYTRVVWEPIRKKLMALPALDKKAAKLQRRLVGHADPVGLDSAGRILVSPLLREMVGLEKECHQKCKGLYCDAGRQFSAHLRISAA